jgi:hypothetical protein
MWKRLLVLIALGVTVACSKGSECANKTTQREQDVCHFERLSTKGEYGLDEALEVAALIDDAVIKSAGVLEWIAKNNREVSPQQGQRLCDVLVNWEKTQCERRLYAAHLQR